VRSTDCFIGGAGFDSVGLVVVQEVWDDVTWQEIARLVVLFVGFCLVYEIFDRAARK
jgi:hypothetical protein